MKTKGPPRWLPVLLGLLLLFTLAFALIGCGKSSEPTVTAASKPPPPVRRTAIPRDHQFDLETGLVANDLKHGEGAARLSVTRRWSGGTALDHHFGAGWSDRNHVRLGLISPRLVLIWRGGVGAHTALLIDGNRFQTDDGETLERGDSGWTLRSARGDVLTFSKDGRLQSDTPSIGPARNFEYDKDGRLTAIATSRENALRYSYDPAGRVIAIDGPEKLRLTYRYDDKGRLASATNSRQVQVDYHYADDGALVSASDNFGNDLDLTNATARLLPPANNASPSSGSGIRFQFDEKGFAKSASEGGETTSFDYDEQGRLVAVISPSGRAHCKYDSFGRISEIQQGKSGLLRFEYNNLDLPTLIAKPDGTTEKRRYDAYGQLVRRERSPTDWEEFSYDGCGRLEARRRPPAAEERYSYDENRRTAIQYPDGRAVRFEYDPAGRILSETWSSGRKRAWRYDANGRLVESVAPAGLRTTYRYDARGDLIASEDDVHGKTTHSLRGGESITESAQGRTVTTTTEWGKPLQVVEPGGARTLFTYDNEGRLRLVTSPLNFPWQYEYDGAGNLTSIKGPGGVLTALDWDAQGRQSRVARGNISWREYRYDTVGRLEQDYSGLGRVARYAYGPDGRRSAAEFPDGKVNYLHAPDGLRASWKGPGYEVEEEYRKDGGLARRKYSPADLELKLPLDEAGRSAGIELNNLKTTYSYDARGELSQITLPGGASIKVVIDEAGRPAEFSFSGNVSQKIGYDRADRVTSIEATDGHAKQIFRERYNYDVAGNLRERATDTNGALKFEYDAESRLTKVTGGKKPQAFAYDIDGNLKTDGDGVSRCEIDAMGRPTLQGATSYSWDSGGNLSRAQNGEDRVDYLFDAAGRLSERRDRKKTWKFGYLDGPDRLWEESDGKKRWYIYAGDRLAGFKDESGVTWLLVCLPQTDRPLALCGSNGQTLFVLHDRLGSARRFVDASGTIVARDDYAPFGKLEATEGKPPLRLFAGMLRDETGLYYARHRYYDSAIGRFISLDPLVGTLGIPSSHNAYAYAANNPLRYRDPMGTGSFEDEIVNYHELYDYVWKKDPRDPTGRTILKDANGDPVPERYPESHPFKGEPIVDKSKPPSPVMNNNYDAMSAAEQRATREAYEGAKAARQAIQNPASTAEQAQAAAQALARHEAELARLNEIGRLRAGHAVMLGGERAGWGGAGSQERMLNNEKRLAELGADPFEAYSPETQAELRGARESQAQAAADAAARDARAQGAFGRGSKTQQVGGKDSGTGTGQVNTGRETGSSTSQVNPARETGSGTTQIKPGAGEGAGANQSDLAASAREKIERSLKTNEAVNVSKEEMAAFRAEEAAKAAAAKSRETALVKSAGESSGSAGTKAGSRTGGSGSAWDEELFTGKSPLDKSGRARDIEMVYDSKNGVWKPKVPPSGGAGSFAAEEEAARRWLGPKILEAGGKVLRPLLPLVEVMGAVDAALLGGKMAQNFIDTLNEPFRQAQLEKAGARWVAERYANDLRQLAHADPDAVITRDGRKFDPNNPRDMEELMIDLSQNLHFGRKPFEGLLTRETTKATSFMGAAPGDTAAATMLAEAWKLMKEAVLLEKEAGKIAAEALREQEEAKSKLQTALTIAGTRAVAESDVAAVPETAAEVKTQTAKVKAQGSAAQIASDEMTAAIAGTGEAATKICDLAQQVASGSEEQVAQWRTQATSALFAASNRLNAAQAKIDVVAVAVDNLRTAMAKLEAFRSTHTLYKLGSGLAEGAGATPDAAFSAAKAAAQRATEARDKLGPMLIQVRGLGIQISGLLAPYLASDVEAAALDAEARRLGFNLQTPSWLDVTTLINLSTPLLEAALNNQRAVEQAIGNADIDSIITAANEALSEADGVKLSVSTLASGPERYRSLQIASQCLALIKPASKVAEATPTPAESAAEEEVFVPDLSVFQSLGEMKAAALRAGLTPALVATRESPPAGSSRSFVRQSPLPNTKAKKNSPLQIFVAQNLVAASPSPIPSPEPTILAQLSPTPSPSATPEETPAVVIVPDVSGQKTPGAMKAAAGPDMVGVIHATSIAPPEGSKDLFAYQEPAAGSKALRGQTLHIYIYQALATAGSTPSPPPIETGAGTMPSLLGLTLDQATSRLTSNMRIGGDEVGDKPPSPEQAYTIYSQNPPANSKIDPQAKIVVTVKRYGSGASAAAGSIEPFLGTWYGNSPYGDLEKPHEIVIRKDEAGRLVIYRQGVTDWGYPIDWDGGSKLSHRHAITDITWVLVGDTMEGTARYTDYKGESHVVHMTLRRR